MPAPFFKPPAAPVAGAWLEKKAWEMLALGTRADNLAGMPVWSAYGEEDPDATAERLALLERLGAQGQELRARYEPGAAHGSMPTELKSPEFWRWLLAQRRAAPPAHVRYVATDLRDNAAWWVKVEQMQSPLEPARCSRRRPTRT